MRYVAIIAVLASTASAAVGQTSMRYDSAFIRSLAGNYRIAADRVISMGPLDEADGWLSFYDSKTNRTGILFAENDSTLFTKDGIRVLVRGHDLVWRAGNHEWTARHRDDIRQREVLFNSAGVRLAGTITSPAAPGRHSAVVLIHGCCGIVPTRDFGYWSAYLAHHGITVLAFDRRGGGKSGGDFQTASYSDLANDVLAAVDVLATQRDVKAARIGVFGMSNGGYVAPLAASRAHGRIAFVAVRSGSARPVGGNIDYEVGNDLRSAGFGEASVTAAVSLRRRVTDFVVLRPLMSVASWDSLKSEVIARQNEPWFGYSRTGWVPRVSPSDSGGAAYINALRTAWEFDPLPYWEQVHVPVYVMLGELDRSVPTVETARVLRAVFRQSGNTKAVVRVFAHANHGLLAAQTGFNNEAGGLHYFVPGFQAGLVSWIKRVASTAE